MISIWKPVVNKLKFASQTIHFIFFNEMKELILSLKPVQCNQRKQVSSIKGVCIQPVWF